MGARSRCWLGGASLALALSLGPCGGLLAADAVPASSPASAPGSTPASAPASAPPGGPGAAEEASRRLQLLQQALTAAQLEVAKDPDQTDARARLLGARLDMGHLQSSRGNLDEALLQYQDALSLAQWLTHRQATAWEHLVPHGHLRVGRMQAALGNRAAALQSFQTGLGVTQRMDDLHWANMDTQMMVSDLHAELGQLQAAEGNLASAIDHLITAQDLARGVARKDPRRSDWQARVFSTHFSLGNVLMKAGDPKAALFHFEASLVIAKDLAQTSPADSLQWPRNLSITLNRIGTMQAARDERAAAFESFQSALAHTERLASRHPGHPQLQRDRVVSLRAMALLGDAAGPVESRRALMHKALDILVAQRKAGTLPPSMDGWIGDVEADIASLD